MEDDIGDIEREQITPESAGGSPRPPNLTLGHSGPSPQDEQLITRLWAQGMSPDVIAQEAGIPLKTVYLILKSIQKIIIEEC